MERKSRTRQVENLLSEVRKGLEKAKDFSENLARGSRANRSASPSRDYEMSKGLEALEYARSGRAFKNGTANEHIPEFVNGILDLFYEIFGYRLIEYKVYSIRTRRGAVGVVVASSSGEAQDLLAEFEGDASPESNGADAVCISENSPGVVAYYVL